MKLNAFFEIATTCATTFAKGRVKKKAENIMNLALKEGGCLT